MTQQHQDVFSIPEGDVTLKWPTPLSPASIADILAWLDIMKRKIGHSCEWPTNKKEKQMEISELKPHQQRVVDEKHELDLKRDRLTEFRKGDTFKSLPADEQERLIRQHGIMAQYSDVLAERIAHF